MTRSTVAAVLTAVALTGWVPTGMAQPAGDTDRLRQDIEALKQGQAAIQKDLQEIKALLRAGQAAGAPPGPTAEAMVNVAGVPFKGKKDARVTMVEFTDYQ